MERNRAVFQVKIKKKIQEKNMPLIAIVTLNFKKKSGNAHLKINGFVLLFKVLIQGFLQQW